MGEGSGTILTGRAQVAAEQDGASVRVSRLRDQKSLLAVVGAFPDNCFMAKVVGKKMENKTKFCCILKVSLEERIVQCGRKSSELNQK